MKHLRNVTLIVLIGLLSGCVASQQNATTQESSSLSKALTAAMKDVPKARFDSCFKARSREERFTMYKVLQRQKNGRECAVAVENYPGGMRSPFSRVSPVAGISDGYSMEDCEMQILQCVDPGAAKQISNQHVLRAEPKIKLSDFSYL